MASGTKFVSVIMPCREEEKYIARALTSILANDYPQDRLEVLVIDGMSLPEIIRSLSSSTTPGE
jgi:glycosyltransferase involved in cell wall biosynthesis